MTKKTSAKKDEGKIVVAYKGFNKSLQCTGGDEPFQYEVGKTYEHDGEVKACSSGFHACENPMDVWNYYSVTDSRFCVVELSGELSRHAEDSKIAGGKITVKAELSLPQFIGEAVRFVMDLCKEAKGEKVQAASGDYSKLAASGDSSKLAASGYSSQLAASGYSSQLAASGGSSKLAASGYSSQLAASGDSSKLAASGDSSKLAASGDYSQLAASGDYSKLAASGYSSQLAASGGSSKLAASGKSSIAMTAAPGCIAKAGENGCIALTRWVESEKRYRVTVGYVGENGIKADTFYALNSAGELEECS